MRVCSGESEKYMIDMRRGRVIDQLTKLMIMPKGLAAGKSVYECTADFQWFFILHHYVSFTEMSDCAGGMRA